MPDQFHSAANAHRRCIVYAFKDKEGRPDWEDFEKFLTREGGKGLADWQLDLRQITLLDSLSIGNLIATNARLGARGSRVSLMVKTNSAVERLLHAARLERLIPITMLV